MPSKAGHAKKIIYLSADAFGVLPPVSILDEDQAQYHFLCGYTSKLAGTERGITAPEPSFSPAFLNLTIPTYLPNVSDGILDPRDTYKDIAEWEAKAKDLSSKYIKNFEQYTNTEEGKRLVAAGPQL